MGGREIIAALAAVVGRLASGDMGRKELAVELRRIADEAEANGELQLTNPVSGEPPLKEQIQEAARADAWKRIFRYWQRALGHERSKPTAERRTKVLARLREGYAEADIIRAIDGCASSPFHTGENEDGTRHDDLTLICRNGSMLERFIERAGEGEAMVPSVTVGSSRAGEMDALTAKAERALSAGRLDEYEKYNRALSHLRGRG